MKDFFIGPDVPISLNLKDKKLGGVCAGVSDYAGVPALWIRILLVAALIFKPVAVLIAYGLACFVLEEKSQVNPEQMQDQTRE